MSSTRPAILASTLERGLRILGLFADTREPMGLTQIAARSGLEKSAAQRLTYTLHALGYLERDEATRRYRPGLRMLDMAFAYLVHDRLLELASPRLIALSRALGVTVNMAVLDGPQIVYKARIAQSSQAYDATLIGVRQHAAITAAGQAIAAFSPPEVLEGLLAPPLPAPFTPFTLRDAESVRARVEAACRDGFAISNQQIMLHEVVLAAPILGPGRQAIAAVSTPVYLPDWDEARIRRELVAPLMETTRALSAR